MVGRLRMPLVLVAALLVVAVMAAAFITWNSLHSNVAPAQHVGLTTVQQLEARPLHISRPKTVAECATGPYDTNGGGFGSGPMYAQGGPSTSSNWGNYFHIYAYARGPVQGPVLVRGIHIFDNGPIVFIGPNAAGPVVGTDTIQGQKVQQHAEAVILDTTVSAKYPGEYWAIPNGSIHFFWPLISAEPLGSTSTSGWQIDGPAFSETFVVC